ncbi:hypothetical protein D1953_00275 [Peribacillus asahii]|uniref:Uncharacterized protein n=1 Tax=Peribacillus asahii TaxID=228899 RepID=A0A398BFA0_9BACI|nr:hypothetical protein [Peribacillus asahii]RID89049.1 hypothetical protein D1953_00275 [Peribacillus asahii]
MNISETQLSVNDYLDLYLYAESINDQLWKQEIVEKLQNSRNEIRKEIQSFKDKHLLEKYKHINEEIRIIYQQLRIHSSNEYLLEEFRRLKQRRVLLGLQIQSAKHHSP